MASNEAWPEVEDMTFEERVELFEWLVVEARAFGLTAYEYRPGVTHQLSQLLSRGV